MKFELDKYTLKARLYPCFVVLFPAFVIAVFFITDFEKYRHYVTAVISLGFFTFLLSEVGRNKGLLKQNALFENWGGAPTTQLLRHRDIWLDPVTKARYHKLLEKIVPDVKMPTVQEEIDDPKKADAIYAGCTRYVITKTRDTKKFPLIFKENISYGFRRNLWGMKSWALTILVGCFVINLYFGTQGFTNIYHLTTQDIALFGFILIAAAFWIIVFTADWIRPTTYAYAERLFEALDTLGKITTRNPINPNADATLKGSAIKDNP